MEPITAEEQARGYCPECGRHTWTVRGCNKCGAQPFVPSFAYQDAVALAKTPTTE